MEKEYNYKSVYHPDCPYADKNGRLSEHIYVWWLNHKNEYIQENEIIHHINKDTSDNRIENLQKVTRREHTIIHNRGIEKVKIKKESKNLYLSIYNFLNEGKYPKQICDLLGLSKQNMNHYLKVLKNQGLVRKVGYATWQIIDKFREKPRVDIRGKKLSSLGTTKPLTNLHALQIKFPIISGTINDKDWEIKEKLNHWLPKYTSLKALGGLTVKNNNGKSITVYAKSRNIKSLEEIDNLSYQIRDYIYIYFKTKHDVELDKYNVEIKNLDIATEDKNAESMRRKGDKFVLNLNKKAEKVFEKDNIDAKAMIDGSPFKFSAETNDKEWKRAYLNMPFSMQQLLSATMYIAKNYESHVKIVEKANKVLGKLDKALSTNKSIKQSLDTKQTKLGDFK